MKLACMSTAAALLAVPSFVLAASGNTLDGYYIPSAELEVDVDGAGSADTSGDGFGVKGAFSFTDTAFFTGEYQSVDYDEDLIEDIELDQIRLGAGYRFTATTLPMWYLRAEFVQLSVDDEDENGYGVHGGVRAENGALGVYAEAGYVDVEEADGFEFTVGADYALTDAIGGFVDYRRSDLEASDGDLTLDDLRVGLRLYF